KKKKEEAPKGPLLDEVPRIGITTSYEEFHSESKLTSRGSTRRGDDEITRESRGRAQKSTCARTTLDDLRTYTYSTRNGTVSDTIIVEFRAVVLTETDVECSHTRDSHDRHPLDLCESRVTRDYDTLNQILTSFEGRDIDDEVNHTVFTSTRGFTTGGSLVDLIDVKPDTET